MHFRLLVYGPFFVSPRSFTKNPPESSRQGGRGNGFRVRMLVPDLIWIDSAPVDGLVCFFQFFQELVVVAPYISPLIRSQPTCITAWLSRAQRHSEYRGD